MSSIAADGAIRVGPDVGTAPSRIIEAMLVLCVVFQLTILPTTLGIKPVSMLVNAGLLVGFALSAALITTKRRVPPAVMFFYLMPLTVALLGYGINFARSLTPASLGSASVFMPFLAAMSVPFLKGYDASRLWTVYYRLMLVICIVSLIEYALVFTGRLPTTPLPTVYASFLKGIVTIFYDYGGGLPHYRFYGVFLEPGTATMLVLPALTYSLFTRRLLGIAVFLAVFVLTNSLGGYMALALTTGIACFAMSGRAGQPTAVRAMMLVSAIPVVIALLGLLFVPEYSQKGASASIRENNVSSFVTGFLPSIVGRPFGFPMSGTTLTALSSADDYYGSNFMIYVAFVQGGVLGLAGYLVLFATACVATARRVFSTDPADPVATSAFVSMPAMLLFSFQRMSVFDTVLFAFLYAAPLVAVLGRERGDAPRAPSRDAQVPDGDSRTR